MLAGRTWGSLLELCYPATCARCGELARSSRLCAACESEMSRLEAAPACPNCAMPLAQAQQPCAYCGGQGLRPLDRIIRLGVFEDPLKHLIHRMKYRGDWTL